MTAPRPGFHRGVTLVEIMVAGAILALLSIALFNGSGLAARLAQENAEFLAADAFAFDLALKRSRESYAKLGEIRAERNGRAIEETISSNAVPILYRASSPAIARTWVKWAKKRDGQDDPDALQVAVDVEWGPSDERRTLSARQGQTVVLKSGIGLQREDR